jgi:hypothetical protein
MQGVRQCESESAGAHGARCARASEMRALTLTTSQHAVKMSFEQASKAGDKNPNFLTNAELKPYIKNSDCSQVSDGGAALLLVSEDALKALGKSRADAVEVRERAPPGCLTAMRVVCFNSLGGCVFTYN